MNNNNNSVMNPMDPRNMTENASNNDKLKVLIDEVKNLRKINKEQKYDLEESENNGSKKMKIGLLGVMIMLGMLAALSVHESSKYFINRSMKLYGYTSNLYLIYPMVVVFGVALVFYKLVHLIN
jgi:hypothetical protein